VEIVLQMLFLDCRLSHCFFGLWSLSSKADITQGFGASRNDGYGSCDGSVRCDRANFQSKLDVAIVVAALVGSFALGNYVLKLSGWDLIAIVDAKLVRHINTTEAKLGAAITSDDWGSARPADTRSGNELHNALREAGIPHNSMYNPVEYLALIDTNKIPPYYPLSSAKTQSQSNVTKETSATFRFGTPTDTGSTTTIQFTRSKI
jgi:hypothetical protein